jgi:hypothetical protein
MVRILACACALFALTFLVGDGLTQNTKPAKNQMVKGTIKTVDLGKNLLVINQKLKDQVVDRELSILDTTEFVVMTGNEKKELLGKDGLRLLEGKEGAQVQVKCDKDVNVLKVTVKLK